MSTKKITESPFGNEVNWSSEDFISIDTIHPDKIDIELDQTLVFTSKNAVKGLLKNLPDINLALYKIVCVGEKTKQLLIDNGAVVAHTDTSSKQLGEWIAQQEGVQRVLFICGNIRRQELKEILEEKEVDYNEVIIYQTNLTPHKVDHLPDGILFLSPSAVQSYVMHNKTPKAIAFCIGNTTALEAKKHFETVEIADSLSYESVINNVKQYYGIK